MYTPDDAGLRTCRLNDGNQIPAVGFGTWTVKDEEEGYKTVLKALEVGYRHIDTASIYGSEKSVGRAIRESGISRQNIFVTTKVAKKDMGYEGAKRSLQQSLEKMQLDYVDLLLIHWPNAVAPGWEKGVEDTWRAFCEAKDKGLVGSVGVSNFLPKHFPALGGLKPSVNQIEYHIGYTQDETVKYCQEQGILVEAWSPLGRKRVFEHPLINEIAGRYKVSVARVCMAFCVQHDILPLPKSATPERMKENLDCFSFRLEQADIDRLSGIGEVGFSGLHPDSFAS